MDRRQFLQTLNASGMRTILPAAAFVNVSRSGIDEIRLPPLKEAGRDETNVGDLAWRAPKIGIVSIGITGLDEIPKYSETGQGLSLLARTVAIDTEADELHLTSADRKVLVGDSDNHIQIDAAKIEAKKSLLNIATAVAGLDMVILIIAAGSFAVHGITPVVVQQLRRQGTLTFCVAVTVSILANGIPNSI